MFAISFDPGPVKRFIEVFPKKVRGGVSRALRRTGTAVQGSLIALFRQRGVGRTIYGKNAAGARKSAIARGKLRSSDRELVQPISIKGLAKLQEEGGRTQEHVIRPKRSKHLVIGGRPITGPVRHPGSNIRPRPFAQSASRQHQTTLASEVEKELQKLIAADYA